MRCGDEVFGVAEGALRSGAEKLHETSIVFNVNLLRIQRIQALNLHETTINRLLLIVSSDLFNFFGLLIKMILRTLSTDASEDQSAAMCCHQFQPLFLHSILTSTSSTLQKLLNPFSGPSAFLQVFH